jgi:hypothetical protein
VAPATLSLRATGAWIYDRDPFVPIQVRFVIVIVLGLCGGKNGAYIANGRANANLAAAPDLMYGYSKSLLHRGGRATNLFGPEEFQKEVGREARERGTEGAVRPTKKAHPPF